MKCVDKRRCTKAQDICAKYAECKYVVMNGAGEWATLKRFANDKEHAELFDYDERGWDEERLKDELKQLQKEGSRWRTKFQRINGFRNAMANRSKAIASILRSDNSTKQLCGSSRAFEDDDVSIALVALSYRTPATLRRSVRSWLETGLLHVVDERIALLNDPTPAEKAICLRHGFDIASPADLVKTYKEPFLRTVKRDVFTIGAAFAAGLVRASSKYVLFLEKDFAMDETLKQNHIIDELTASIAMLQRGAALVRLRSLKDQGCGTFRRCKNDANMPNWRGQTTFERRRNWWSFYCKDFHRPGSVADCAVGSSQVSKTNGIHFRCFSSWDSNWSLNAVLVDREKTLTTTWRSQRTRFQHGLTLADYGASTWNKQDGFEVGMLRDDWGKLHIPLCLSVRGLFRHIEVDG